MSFSKVSQEAASGCQLHVITCVYLNNLGNADEHCSESCVLTQWGDNSLVWTNNLQHNQFCETKSLIFLFLDCIWASLLKKKPWECIRGAISSMRSCKALVVYDNNLRWPQIKWLEGHRERAFEAGTPMIKGQLSLITSILATKSGNKGHVGLILS